MLISFWWVAHSGKYLQGEDPSLQLWPSSFSLPKVNMCIVAEQGNSAETKEKKFKSLNGQFRFELWQEDKCSRKASSEVG